MTLLQRLQGLSEKWGYPFVLIGGHAVNIHGYSRMTADIDIMVRRNDLAEWKDALAGLGYEAEYEAGPFAQFTATGSNGPRLDLMLVNESTFEKIARRAATTRYLEATINAVCVEHLIALKLHVLRQDLEHRRLKDFLDVVELVKVNQVDLQSAEMQEIFARYGTEDLLRRIKLAL